MKSKLFILLCCSYLIAFVINLIPSIKHPDSTMTIIHLFASTLLVIALSAFIKMTSFQNVVVKNTLFIGFISGLMVYTVNFLTSLTEIAMIDILAAIQYPFYLIFVTPFFGMNYLVGLSYDAFSLLLSAVYLFAFVFVMDIHKKAILKE
ncbi:hypothetical protein [Sporosarcina cyprini]|uniref:hypothetical protein n=1 Tax=Sporosarcina cyprini TaxID=2910523 RepID=UPI001EE0F025|nr:hypothetical protein [Sporosarcina cyprini]MCG3088927.1 hypothetical protein [Sporosarcina cyprini]